jgi:undecaprenyl pyrophosphate synthase
MESLKVKSSTIFISVRGGTRVYRSIDEVPPELRRRLEETTTGANARTILIANRKGREELVRAIETRTTAEPEKKLVQSAPAEPASEPEGRVPRNWKPVLELGALVLAVLTLWLFFFWK